MTTRPVPNHGAERRRDIATVALNSRTLPPVSYVSLLESYIDKRDESLSDGGDLFPRR